MALKVRNYTVTVGRPCPVLLAQAQDEDCQYNFTFVEPPASQGGSGNPVDFTNLASNKAIMTIRDPQGNLIASRVGAVSGLPTAGTLSFVITQTDLLSQAVQQDVADVKWTDTNGYTEQLLIAEPFNVLQSVSQPTDVPTSPPPVPVYPMTVRAHFDGTTAEVAITWPLQPSDVWVGCATPQTDDISGLEVWPINASVTRSGCTLQATAPFIGDVLVFVLLKTQVLNGN